MICSPPVFLSFPDPDPKFFHGSVSFTFKTVSFSSFVENIAVSAMEKQ
jgi:hypothetical protein